MVGETEAGVAVKVREGIRRSGAGGLIGEPSSAQLKGPGELGATSGARGRTLPRRTGSTIVVSITECHASRLGTTQRSSGPPHPMKTRRPVRKGHNKRPRGVF